MSNQSAAERGELATLDRFISGAPGIYPDVPFPMYLRSPIMSQSVLKQAGASMAHLKAAVDQVRKKTVTDDMALGSALHTCFMEPELMPQRVVLWDGGPRRGKEWAEFCTEHSGKVILTEGYYAKLVGMVAALRKHPFVRKWVSQIEQVEVSAIGEINGVKMRGRCDALTPDPMIDLKKVVSADSATFTRTILNYGYDVQGHVYRELFNRDRFVLLTVEDSPPFDIVPHELSPAFLRIGKSKVTQYLDRYKFCLETNEWPGRANDVVLIEPPEWATEKSGVNVTINGESAFGDED